jgi:hypothetical protein
MCRLKDSDLAKIATMNSLQTITLFGEDITDQGLMSLGKCGNIRGIVVKRCANVTADGIRKFKLLRPDCKVHYVPAKTFSENQVRPEIDLLESTISDPDD